MKEIFAKLDNDDLKSLRVGDVIKIHGFIMLKGLDGGKQYVVEDIYKLNYHGDVVCFRLKRGKRTVTHEAGDIVGSIRCFERGDNNGIEVVGGG